MKGVLLVLSWCSHGVSPMGIDNIASEGRIWGVDLVYAWCKSLSSVLGVLNIFSV